MSFKGEGDKGPHHDETSREGRELKARDVTIATAFFFLSFAYPRTTKEYVETVRNCLYNADKFLERK